MYVFHWAALSNCSYVVAPEGTYVARMDHTVYPVIVDSFRRYLKLHKYTDRETDAALDVCDQPRKDMLAPLEHKLPELYQLLHLPAKVYFDLTRGTQSQKTTQHERIHTFCARMRDVGIQIKFLPSDRYLHADSS